MFSEYPCIHIYICIAFKKIIFTMFSFELSLLEARPTKSEDDESSNRCTTN